MIRVLLFALFLTHISAKNHTDKFKILVTAKESKSFINDIGGLSSNDTLIYLLYTYSEPYRLVKLNTSNLHSISTAILPYHYNDTIFRQDFFLLPFSDNQLFVGYVQDLGKSDAATWLQAIDLKSMSLDMTQVQSFPFKQFTGFPLFQAVPNRNKIIINLMQWSSTFLVNNITSVTLCIISFFRDLVTKQITTPQIIGGQLPSSAPDNNWLLPSLSSFDSTPQLLLMYEKNILFTLNVSSSSQWSIIQQLSSIQLEFLSKSLSFHMDIVNATTIAVADNDMNVFIYNLYKRQLTSKLNLRERFPDYPRMADEIANNLIANNHYVYVTSSTNAEPYDKQYLFRISLNDTMHDVDLLQFSDENYGLTELVTSADTVYSFERLYEAQNYFNIYKIGTPPKILF